MTQKFLKLRYLGYGGSYLSLMSGWLSCAESLEFAGREGQRKILSRQQGSAGAEAVEVQCRSAAAHGCRAAEAVGAVKAGSGGEGVAGKEETQDERSGTRADYCGDEEAVGGVSRGEEGSGQEEGCGVTP